ncbi:polyprenyl synthetase family protein, partial [Erysipelatoclostridium ramosum]
GRLLSLPLVCAALIAERNEDVAVWERIGADTGLSFQIQDDILDVTSTVEELGKNINSDAENDKTTYVTLMGIE